VVSKNKKKTALRKKSKSFSEEKLYSAKTAAENILWAENEDLTRRPEDGGENNTDSR